MQKISSYLYPNRISLLADMAGFSVEYTSVYQRTVKLYNGIDNTLEFDIKNADQKRIDLSAISSLELNLMDASGNAISGSPYRLDQIIGSDNLPKKGLAKCIIPQEDINDYTPQFFKYSVSGVKDGNDVLLYADTRFGAVGTMELVGNAMPTFRSEQIYKTFTGEIDFSGNVVKHTSAIPTTFYEADPTAQITLEIATTGFVGKIWYEGTSNSTISVNSFLNATKHDIMSVALPATAVYTVPVNIGDFKYIRVSYQSNHPVKPTGTVDSVTVI